jgi:hypothetical protein
MVIIKQVDLLTNLVNNWKWPSNKEPPPKIFLPSTNLLIDLQQKKIDYKCDIFKHHATIG